jgi:hypothetical protein
MGVADRKPTRVVSSHCGVFLALNRPVGEWDGFRGRLRLYLQDEAPVIGTGWRSLTIRVAGNRVRLTNHWTEDAKWIGRDCFERLAAHSLAHGHTPTKAEPVSKLLDNIAPRYTPLWSDTPKVLPKRTIPDDYPELPAFRKRLRLVVSNPTPRPSGVAA